MSDKCSVVHKLVNGLKEHRFSFEESEIPLNGVYILFEKGEFGHGQKRIVRIGTHTGDDQLRSRINQHFLRENKDRSIFRKNIGRAILNKRNDPFLGDWEIDLTTKKAREQHASRIDNEYQKQIEIEVSEYIKRNCSFCTFEVRDKKTRLDIELKLISTVSWCNQCRPTQHWLGKHSPKEKISQSGLWLVNGLYKIPADASDVAWLSTLIKGKQPLEG